MNNINVTSFNSSQQYINGQLINNYNHLLNYDGDSLDIEYQNNDNVVYKKLTNDDLINLINYNYNNKEISIFDLLKSEYYNDKTSKFFNDFNCSKEKLENNPKKIKKTLKKSKKKSKQKKNYKKQKKDNAKSIKNSHLIDTVF